MIGSRIKNLVFIFLAAILFCSCSAVNNNTAEELPLFGGRPRTAKEIRRDNQFRQAAIKESGSSQAAAAKFIKEGFISFRQGDLSEGTRKFNRAWLISPGNPDIFWGFGNILGVKGELDRAIEMFNRAIELSPQHVRAISDLAYAYLQQAHYARDNQQAFLSYLDQSDKAFARANKIDPKYELCYSNWAISLYMQKRFKEAWKKIAAARKLGGKTIDQKFLKDLAAAMPEPKE